MMIILKEKSFWEPEIKYNLLRSRVSVFHSYFCVIVYGINLNKYNNSGCQLSERCLSFGLIFVCQGSLNIYIKDEIISAFLTSQQYHCSTSDQKKTVLIFHCEFSSERGPRL